MELPLKITGILLIALAISHIFFAKYFRWKEDLGSLSLINRQMLYVHSFFIATTVFMMGILCTCCVEDMIHTRLGHYLAFGFFIFWFLRLLFQFFVYSPTLWKGRTFETLVHILFSLLWAWFALVFFLIYYRYSAR